ncbi:NAD(P)/FAD-dependent oxidoreductase [Methanosarcina sp. DH2]|uniref:dihydrolipoyl dehydrogenase family protein n=1 Tax=Methanosarcina sp. DH2 TaxID=2605639 RepID=UPI001E5F16CB|nr:NAD(P)/FAD-dependent oxidoreductase [Methanosarcina sp. DH2]MCC4768998.1 NAD(P)/FAD-dependent oxidoreductase [Methanosarcina sp. DH2]
MENKYDIIIIGTGTAGRTLAGRAKSSGLKFAIIDSREYGGTCPLRGCDPKKVLAGVSEATDLNNRLIGKGAGTEKPLLVYWPSLIEFKRTFTEGYPREAEKMFADMGIDMYRGRAHFENENTVLVGKDKLKGKYIFLATGSKPRKLSISGEEYMTTSEEFMEIEKFPGKIIFVGGGYISLEFAHIARRVGSEVLILHRSEKLLGGFDFDLVNMLVKASEAAGIRILTNRPVVAVEKGNNGFLVSAEYKTEKQSEIQTFNADMVVNGAGRIPDFEDLRLENAGVEAGKKGIIVDKQMRTSNPRVYAGGDCTAEGMQLTPVATLQGEVAAANILDGSGAEADYTGIPSAVFTIPVLASVGISEAKENSKYRVIFRDRSKWNTTRRAGLEFAASKVIIDETKDRIAGAHILGPNAEEAINIFAMAMRLGLRASDIRKMVFTYPTVCSDIRYML